ncbi:nucleolar and spindle-associated protein 1-like [Haliotis rubra]|uniref:nucleolar and spindle-associated protein 1-like n=1 Tax=Haliotis rubra TaxID=36100 RepID=UPI001EE621AD|nr:nucleolar and spindle-associated protein 1-like [Haliotis rubra]
MEQMLKNIDDMKYNELQKIAKGVGIKANVKIDKLQKALREYYSQQAEPGNTNPKHDQQKHEESVTSDSMDTDEVETKPARRVTKKAKRRGRGKKAAKKTVEEEPEPEVKLCATPVAAVKAGSKKTTPHTPEPSGVGVKVKPSPMTPKMKVKDQVKPSPMTPQMRTVMTLKQTKTPLSQKRKRSGSLLKPQVDSKPSTPVAEPSNKRIRRSTFEKKDDMNVTPSSQEVKDTSPGVKDILGVMKPEMNSAERKATLLKALDEKVQKVTRPRKTGTPTRGDEKSTCSTQIPRFAAFLAKKKQESQKVITPGNKDWTKVHKKEFDKFDSIDVYLEKKRQRTKSITKSVSKVSQILEESKKAITSLRNQKTPSSENMVKPKPKNDAKINLFKSPSGPTPFKPSVFKTKNMNTNFGAKTPNSNPGAKTPVTLGPGKKTTPKAGSTVEKKADRKSLGVMSTKKTTGVTPFKFTGTLNTTMPDGKSTKKPFFDLKASLARPVTWRTHKGKLKPVGDSTYAQQPGSEIKAPRVASRDDRRAAMAQHRANKKFSSQMQRRGIKT